MHYKNENKNKFIYLLYLELALFVIRVTTVTTLSTKLPALRYHIFKLF